MGGVLVLGTIDPLQLQPIRAKPALLSSLIPTSFKMVEMKCSVRARSDKPLQRLQEISRFPNPNPMEVKEFKHIIIQKCKHVKSWDDPLITVDIVRVLGTKQAMVQAEEKYYLQLEQKQCAVVRRLAETSQAMASSHGNWKAADDKTSNSLDRLVHEVKLLQLHKNIVVEMTYNKSNYWSHSQMGIVTDLPSQDILDNWKPISIMLAPVGTKVLPVHEPTKKNLQDHGWKEVKVGIAPDTEHKVGRGMTAKRKQYGLKARIAMTIHKAMGGDFGSIVSCVGTCNDGFRLWLKEQVQVLISRTHKASDLIFVGESPQQTADALAELLFKESPYTSYMLHVVEQMCRGVRGEASVIRPLRYMPYNVRNTIIPTGGNGFVYVLMSLKDQNTTYIGQTENLMKRICQHNSGIGAYVTADPNLRPWHIIGFITGFEMNNRQERMQIECLWQSRRNLSGKHSINPLDILNIGKRIVAMKNNGCLKEQIYFVQCLEFKGY